MKEKRSYSLTAKERKAKRAAEQSNKKWKRGAVEPEPQQENIADGIAAIQDAEAAMIKSRKRAKRSAIIVWCIVAIAVLLIISALIIPVVLFVVNPYRGYGDTVVARFKLSNGMVLEYAVDEKDYDTAATNFIFLAKNKFFDNTVFYDAQAGWLRFGGFDDQPRDGSATGDYSRTQNRCDDIEFCNNFTALPNEKFQESNAKHKFGYRLRADSNGTKENLLNSAGSFAFRYDGTSTEFQFYVGDVVDETIPSDISQIKSTMVGHALNDETKENILAIYSTGQRNVNITTGFLWKPPTPSIKIASVDVFNLDGAKWNKFDFLKYMSENDSSGSRRYTQWVGRN